MCYKYLNDMELLNRRLKIDELASDSIFLWGARQTGKSTWLKATFTDAVYYDLLLPNVFMRLKRNPERLIEELKASSPDKVVIIDEVQQLPELLNAVHWLIENCGLRFILCGSSARKLKRLGSNMLGGRALKRQLFPFVSCEIPDFDILHAASNGMIPRHYLVGDAWNRLEGYVGNYLTQEIEAEALTRNLESFTRFLEVAALTDGEIVNYNNIAADCGVSAKAVKTYLDILVETMIGYFLPAYQKVQQRRLIKAPKFYMFDVGIVNYLCNRRRLTPGSAEFGHAFEHLIVQELFAYRSYERRREPLSYWRTAAGHEVDVVIGDAQVAIELKSTTDVQPRQLKGLKAFKQEHPGARAIVVSLDAMLRMVGDIEVWPATQFLRALWNGDIWS